MNRYLEQKILMADPVELVQMVYQAAITSVRDARTYLREKKITQRTRAINQAYAAIHELNVALDLDSAPEMATRLRGLYLYIERRLIEANAKKTDAPLAEILGLLSTLSEAWASVVEAHHPAVAKSNVAFLPAALPASETPTERLALIA